ncbi:MULTISPECIES: translation elongation factor Ts [unclassified Wenzhouxiangella]|uniref:translation elongation factor Ts n=1 Tax=unclassified Wenzhouxiangella TaxID=2613841 RepID=UPI000E329500|nr:MULTISPECIES: translation elongation factor Ts [unclassified Wenzhouxiangella]RFF27092.1 elongation factor Ts [Wenzhouxiangella sp. 15181]RFP69222.1 elongation factor Ts [Wenzhouxiangella sp. 15190]
MSISAAQVKELRDRTGAGMMECKKALVETDGDMDAALEHLRKSGLAKADKKSDRVAAEGAVIMAESGDRAVLVEINCETDFVAKDDNFRRFANEVAGLALTVDNVDALNEATMENGQSVAESAKQLIAKLGENIRVRRMAPLSADGGIMGGYIHGGRIGVLVALKGGDEELARDLAMHIAALNPVYRDVEDVPSDVIDSEKQILVAQAEDSGKPPEIIEKMVTGRLNKRLAEITLTGQPFVKDSDQTVGKLLKNRNASVEGFVRLEVGEGIEKEEDDFAAEVMEQARG